MSEMLIAPQEFKMPRSFPFTAQAMPNISEQKKHPENTGCVSSDATRLKSDKASHRQLVCSCYTQKIHVMLGIFAASGACNQFLKKNPVSRFRNLSFQPSSRHGPLLALLSPPGADILATVFGGWPAGVLTASVPRAPCQDMTPSTSEFSHVPGTSTFRRPTQTTRALCKLICSWRQLQPSFHPSTWLDSL